MPANSAANVKNDINNVNVFIAATRTKEGFTKLTKLLKLIMLCRFYVLSVYDYINYNPLTHTIVEKYEVNIHISYSILYFSRILFYFISLFKTECLIFK